METKEIKREAARLHREVKRLFRQVEKRENAALNLRRRTDKKLAKAKTNRAQDELENLLGAYNDLTEDLAQVRGTIGGAGNYLAEVAGLDATLDTGPINGLYDADSCILNLTLAEERVVERLKDVTPKDRPARVPSKRA